MKGKEAGFTLIELLVVIAIIGLLSSVVLASVNRARNKALTVRAQTDLQAITKDAIMAQGETGNVLLQITGTGCTNCSGCRDGLSHKDDTGLCYTSWVNSLTAINNASNGYLSNIEGLKRDPWGTPYMLDENEQEGGPANCAYDNLRSAGPDGIVYTADDVVGTPGGSIPHIRCP